MANERVTRINRKSAKDDLVELLNTGKMTAGKDYKEGEDLTHVYKQGVLDAAKAVGIRILDTDHNV